MSSIFNRQCTKHSFLCFSRCLSILFAVGLFPIANVNAQAVIEEVIVTAQKRTESIQDVPISITAITQDSIERKGFDDLSDFGRKVPGMHFVDRNSFGRFGVRQINMRGISTDDAVGYYIDEAALFPIDIKLFDVNRIEVLRGPQSTLYGANSLSGTMKVVTNKPDPSGWDSRLDVSGMDTHKGEFSGHLNAMVNVPLNDTTAARVVGIYRNDGGYIDNLPDGDPSDIDKDYNNEEVWGLRVSLQMEPIEGLTVTPNLFIQRHHVDGKREFDSGLGELQAQHRPTTPADEDLNFFNLTWSYDLKWAEFTSSTTYFEQDIVFRNDFDQFGLAVGAAFNGLFAFLDGFAPGLFLDPLDWDTDVPLADRRATDTEIWTQEFRLASTGEERLNWQAGFWYRSNEADFKQSVQSVEAGQEFLAALDFSLADTPGFLPGVTPPAADGATLVDNVGITTRTDFAAFGDISYALTDRLTIAAGLRWFSQDFEEVAFTVGMLTLSFDRTPEILESDETGIRPRFYASYQLTEDIMLYGTAAEGFRQGGANQEPLQSCLPELAARGLSPDDVRGFESDSLWNYEGGFKSILFDDRLLLNVAGYYMDWDEVQQFVLLNCGSSFTGNGGKASSKGLELETLWQATDHLVFEAAISWNEAQLEEDATASLGPDAVDGASLLSAPEWQVNVGAQYRFPVHGQWEGYVRGDYQYVDEVFVFYDFSDPSSRLPSYDTVNFRIGLTNGDSELSLFFNNAFDERPLISLTVFGETLGSPQFTTIRPRTIGINFKTSLW